DSFYGRAVITNPARRERICRRAQRRTKPLDAVRRRVKHERPIFDKLEAKLNTAAECGGSIEMRVPMLYLEGWRFPSGGPGWSLCAAAQHLVKQPLHRCPERRS